jgi:hypothetical protein
MTGLDSLELGPALRDSGAGILNPLDFFALARGVPFGEGRALVTVADELSDDAVVALELSVRLLLVPARWKKSPCWSPSARTTAETTRAGAGADSPGSFHEPDTDTPELDLVCPRKIFDLLLRELVDLWDTEIGVSLDNPFLSFQDDERAHSHSIATCFFPFMGSPIRSFG